MSNRLTSRVDIGRFSRAVVMTLVLFPILLSSSSAQQPEFSTHNDLPRPWYEQSMVTLPIESPSVKLTGQWTFSEVFSISLAGYWCENNVAVADFDHDGLQDIALLATTDVPVPWSSKVVLLHNQGNWQFVSTVVVEYPGEYGDAIQTGDLNGDGWADLVVQGGSRRVMLNNQLGAFDESWIGGNSNSVGLAYLDSNASLDMLSGRQTRNGGQVEAFLNNGSATSFVKSWESPLYGGGHGTITNVFPATLNNDSATDIVATEIYSGTLVTFTGNGTGTSFTQRDLIGLGNRTFGLAVGNVNSDMLTDVAAYVGWGQARVFLSQGNTLSEVWQSPNLGDAAFNVELTDFDNDGFDDLFVGTFSDGVLRAYKNHSGIDFELMWSGVVPGSGHTGTAADLDNNDYPDLIVGEQDSAGQSHIRILRNNMLLDKFTYLPLIRR